MHSNPRTHRTQAPSPALAVHETGLCLTPPELLARGKVRSCSSLPLPGTFSTLKDVATSRPSLNFPELKLLSPPELNWGTRGGERNKSEKEAFGEQKGVLGFREAGGRQG